MVSKESEYDRFGYGTLQTGAKRRSVCYQSDKLALDA